MNNQLSPVSWQTIFKKSLVWGLWLFFLSIIQTSLFSVFRPFGAVPDLVLAAVIVIAIYDRERTGVIAGIVGGFMADALGGWGLSLSPLVYMLCAALFSLLAYSVLRRDFLSSLIGTACSLVISGIASVICAYSSIESAHFTAADVFGELLIPQFFSSILMGIPVYILTKLIWSRFFNTREMEG